MGRRLTLILGGARSGKSLHAEKLAAERGGAVLYVATAEAKDEEMSARIAEHRARRPPHWTTLEAPSSAGALIRDHAGDVDVLLLDCVTLLANNVLLGLPESSRADGPSAKRAAAALDAEIDDLLAAYTESDAEWILVSNELGLGLVPPYPLGRLFRDALGKANQRLAAAADEVLFMVAGLPLRVK